jgi:hypothetical protein
VSADADFEVPKGSVAAGRRVALPAGAEPPFTVYINGIPQAEGTDYRIEGSEIVFTRPILKEEVGGMRWLAMFLGLFGTYRKHETVDLEYRSGGQVRLASDVEIRPD